MNYAYVKDGDPMSLNYHNDDRGFFGIEVSEDGSIIGYVVEEDGFDFFLFHGYMMWVAWGLFALL